MSAEAIAAVVADLRAGGHRVVNVLQENRRAPFDIDLYIGGGPDGAWLTAPVVDATTLYQTIQPSKSLVDLYGDHPCIAPPWDRAFIGFENRFGNVLVTQMAAVSAEGLVGSSQEPRWETDNPVDWGGVRWLVQGLIWIGGRSTSTGQVIPTMGPMFMEQYAVYPDGEPADLHWVQLAEQWDNEASQMHLRINLGVLNFLACRNVALVEPSRPRAERRRLERTGVRVSTINVFPVGRSTKSASAGGEGGTPLTSVRGHFASYGERFGRGRLFGRLEGRFFRPQHARGTVDAGEIEQRYVIHPEPNDARPRTV